MATIRFERFHAINVGHRDVEQDEIGLDGLDDDNGLGASGGSGDVIAAAREKLVEDLPDFQPIVDHQHLAQPHRDSILLRRRAEGQ